MTRVRRKVATDKRPPTRAVTVDDLGRRSKAKVRNGHTTLSSMGDGRSTLVKSYRSLVDAIVADQGNDLSTVRFELVRRFAGCAVLAGQIEASIVAADPVKVEEYGQLISALVRVAQRIGLDRIPRNITPSLRDYLDARADQREYEDGEEVE